MQEAQRLESLGLLAGGIAHDFNNILTGVLGHAELAALDAPPESALHHALRQIVTGAQHAAGLTRQMLAYAGKGQFVLQPVSLTAIVREIAELLQVSLGRNTTLCYRLADPLPLIEADIAQIQQVIMNLLTNAAEALGDGVGSITVKTAATTLTGENLARLPDHAAQRPSQYVMLEVSDTGCGIAPEVLHRIFEPFYTTKFTGRGLGLAAVQGIVRSHEGLLDVVSQPGAGTSVRVWLPVSERPARSPAGAFEPPTSERGTVLIIEDEAAVRDVLARLVERLGYTPVLASDGAAGMEVLRRGLPMARAVLVDVTMPGMNGVEVARAISRTQPDVPVILMSGYSADEVTMRYGELPALALLQKPCTLAALRAVLHRAPLQEGRAHSEEL
jgi:CheY-like chemotaxis protein